MRHHSKNLSAFICLSGLLGAPLYAQTVQAVLERMDKEAALFRRMTAKLKKSTFTAVLNDTTEESGGMWLKKSGRGIEMRGEIEGTDQRSFGFRDNKAEIYYPKMNTVQIYELGKERSLIDQFLLLGFGSTGKDLQKNYEVKFGGEEVVGGQNTTRLELIPKSAKVLEQIRKVELWFPFDAGHPVQQKFLQPGGNFYQVVYSDIKLNPDLPDSEFVLKLPAGVQKDYPQKN